MDKDDFSGEMRSLGLRHFKITPDSGLLLINIEGLGMCEMRPVEISEVI